MSTHASQRNSRAIRPRHVALGAASVLLAVVALSGCWSNDQQRVLDQINASRRGAGLRALNADSLAMDKAQAWANHMAQTGVLEHSGGGSRISTSGLGRWCAVAENVGVGGSLSIVHNAFLGSGGHRANIMGNYDRAGTGVAYGRGQVWVVHIFLRGSC